MLALGSMFGVVQDNRTEFSPTPRACSLFNIILLLSLPVLQRKLANPRRTDAQLDEHYDGQTGVIARATSDRPWKFLGEAYTVVRAWPRLAERRQ